ncbi:ABC transporter substrate-binding protein [Streptomyces albus subsp. albus]|nr:ABC transporter substrate-binding protein [Streptomyces albus subsp. albus]
MRRRVLSGVLAAVALSATACGGGGGGPSDGSAGRAGAGFPVTVSDCDGNKSTFHKAPSRIVTSNAASLEMLLWLGAGDKVIGTGFPPGRGTMPARFADQAAKVRVLGRTMIAKERLLGSGAEVYIDTFGPMKLMGGAAQAPREEEFRAAGISHVYLHSTACAAQTEGPRTDLSGVADDIRQLGRITGTSRRAGELVAGMRKTTDQVRTALAGVPESKRPRYFFFDYDAGTKQPVAVCGKQVANAVITLAGARNVFADCDGDFKQVGWEDVVAKNPEWIQLGVRDRGSAAANDKAFDEAEDFLRDFPATRGLKAVKAGRFVRVGSERTTIGGVRSADTVHAIARTLYPGRVK